MKICYVAVDVILLYHRGSSTHTYEIARNLVKLGHEVCVISRRLSGRQSKHEVISGVRVYRINRGILIPLSPRGWQVNENGSSLHVRILRGVYRLYLRSIYLLYAAVYTAYIARKHNADVIFERGSSLGVGALAAKLMRKPLVLEIIDPNYASISVETARKIFIYTKSVLREDVGDDRLVIVTAGADIGLFRPDINGSEVRRKYNIGEGVPVVGYVGIFARWHGVEDLIEASKITQKEVPEVKFLMVGPNYYYTQKTVKKLGLSEAFVFTGPVPYNEVPKYIAASNIIVAPYNPFRNPLMRKHGYYFSPIKIFEAMSCGKPVVTTSVDIVKDLVKNGENGLLIPPGSSKELAYAIVKLLKDKRYRRWVGENARKHIEEKYSWVAIAKTVDDAIKSVVVNENVRISITSSKRELLRYYRNQAVLWKKRGGWQRHLYGKRSNPWKQYYHMQRKKYIEDSIPSGGTFLDIGCAEGMYIKKALARGVWCAIGLDISKPFLLEMKKNIPLANPILGDAESLPLKNNSIDITLCSELLEHVQSPKNALKELMRATRKRVIISTPTEENAVIRVIRKLLKTDVRYIYKARVTSNFKGQVEHLHLLNTNFIITSLKKAGYNKITTKGVYVLLPIPFTFIQKLPPQIFKVFQRVDKFLGKLDTISKLGKITIFIADK